MLHFGFQSDMENLDQVTPVLCGARMLESHCTNYIFMNQIFQT